MKLKIDDIILELLDDQHAGELFKLTDANRSYLKEWLPWLDAINSENDTKRFIAISKQQHADHNGFQLTINRKGRIVGMIGLHYIDHEHQKTSIGYWIAQAYQKQGIVVRSCQALIDYCVQELALTTIEISCATHNLKSQTIPKRLGFKKVKTVENAENLYGTMVDHHIFIFKK